MSPDDLGFEPFDEELGHQLRSAAPHAPDADGALDALRPRLERARRRRRAALAGAWGLAGSGVVALALVLVGPGSNQSLHTTPASSTHDDVTTMAPVLPGPVPRPDGGETGTKGMTTTTVDDAQHGGPAGGPEGPDADDHADHGSGDSGHGSGDSGTTTTTDPNG